MIRVLPARSQPQRISEDIPDRMPERIAEHLWDKMRMPDSMSGNVSKKVYLGGDHSKKVICSGGFQKLT